MEALVEFSIPVKGLRDGIHTYKFHLDNSFFSHFEQSPIQKGEFEAELVFEKRPEMFTLDFLFKGTVKKPCDRCLVTVDIPVEGENRLLVKFSEEPQEDAEVVFVQRDISSLHVARYLYEYLCLSLPLINVFECEALPNPPCDQKILDRLDEMANLQNEEESEPNTIWDELKNKIK